MNERIPSRSKPESIPAPTLETRTRLGFEIRKIKKDGSRLQELKKPGVEAVLRHSELTPESMAGWQFLHTYAGQIIDESFAKELFGPAGKPHVAPLLQKDGHDRVRYEKKKAVALASIAGFDTEALRDELDIRNEYGAYIQPRGMVDNRSEISINYLMLKDVLKEHPEIDSDGRLQKNLEAMWDEFVTINQNSLRGGSPRSGEVRKQDYDHDGDRVATLSLIKKAFLLSNDITRACVATKQSEATWQGKPLHSYLTMALHINNMSAQHLVMWYMGFSHGHPHGRNGVSTMNDPDSAEGSFSPVTTSIIDFDALTFSPEKLAHSDELFKHVRPEKIREQLRDKRLPVPLKYQLLAYLPADAWDEEVQKFVRTHRSPLRAKVCRELAYRAQKDTASRERYMELLHVVYGADMETREPHVSTVEMLNGNRALLDANHPGFGPAIRYIENGELPASPKTLIFPASVLILECMKKKYFEHYQKVVPITPEELAFVVLEVKRAQENGAFVARSILHELYPYSGTTSVWDLLKKLNLEGSDKVELLEGIILSAGFERGDHGNSRDAYKELRTQIQKRTAGADRSMLLQTLDAHAKERIDAGFVLRRKLGL